MNKQFNNKWLKRFKNYLKAFKLLKNRLKHRVSSTSLVSQITNSFIKWLVQKRLQIPRDGIGNATRLLFCRHARNIKEEWNCLNTFKY